MVAIIPAAGSGKRIGQKTPKQFLKIRGKPVFVYILEKFDRCTLIDEVILVVPANDVGQVEKVVSEWGILKVNQVVAGGAERQDSVQRGLEVISKETEFVVVHDAVRPFVSVEKIEEVIETAIDQGAAILAVPVKDTVKKGVRRWVEETLNRDVLWYVQTPQVFRADWIREGYKKAYQEGCYVTDDATLVERLGHPIRIVEGEERNMKITSPEDLLLANLFAEEGEG